MSHQAAWQQALPNLNASGAVLTLAKSLTLTRVDGITFYFDARQPVSGSAAGKLARAVSKLLQHEVTLIMRQLPHGTPLRFYSNHV